jgi:L-cysteine:1D-myo-inositol 2-amino-2-deoxy-alpha-D-glucopyranoside ligase
MRSALAADLNAPAALEAVDRWAARAHSAAAAGSQPDRALVSDALDALLGVVL